MVYLLMVVHLGLYSTDLDRAPSRPTRWNNQFQFNKFNYTAYTVLMLVGLELCRKNNILQIRTV